MRWMWQIAGAIALLVAATTLALTFEPHLARLRAERLLADIRSLEVRHSTAADATRIARAYPDSTTEGNCATEGCSITIQQENIALQLKVARSNNSALNGLFSGNALDTALFALGGKSAHTVATIRVENGLVAGTGFLVAVERERIGGYPFALIGQARTVSSLYDSTRHPGYAISQPDGCTMCIGAFVSFTPSANPGDVQRLMQFDLGCLESWRHCTERQDIMPVAWKEHLEEDKDDQKQP